MVWCMVVVCKYDYFYSMGDGGKWCSDVVATSANIMRTDFVPCNLVVTFCYSL